MGDDKKGRSDLEAFGDKLAQARGEPETAQKASSGLSFGAGAGDGLRVAIEFVVSVFVGAGLGFTIGSFFGASVVGLIVGLPIGFAAGLRTVYRGLMAESGETEAESGDSDGAE